MQITFSDSMKTKLDYLYATEGEEVYNGSSRRVLTVEMNKNAIGLDELHSIMSDPKNISYIVLKGDPVEVYKTKTVTQEVYDTEGNPGTVQNEIFMLDSKGQPIVDHVESPTSVYEGYTLPLFMGIDRKQVQMETSEAPAKYEGRLVVKLGKPTYIEKQLEKLGVM